MEKGAPEREKPDASGSNVRHSTAVNEDAPARNPALVVKLTEVFNAERHLDAAVTSLRVWFNVRKPGEDFGLRLLDCTLWAANLEWLLVQAQIIAKGEEE